MSFTSFVSMEPFSLVSSADTCWELPVTLSRSLMMMLKSTSPMTDPLSLLLDTVPLTTTLYLQPSNQFLIHWVVHPSNPYISNLERFRDMNVMWDHICLAEVQVDDISYSFFVYWWCHSITESHQMGQAWSTSGASVQWTFQAETWCSLARSYPILHFLKTGSVISIFLVIWDFTWQSWITWNNYSD